jgi:hypothetical protein
MGRYVPPKCRLTVNGLHGVISQKIVLFITTAVRTSDPTNLKMFFNKYGVSVFIWFEIGSSGGLSWTHSWYFGFHKRLLASQGLPHCSPLIGFSWIINYALNVSYFLSLENEIRYFLCRTVSLEFVSVPFRRESPAVGGFISVSKEVCDPGFSPGYQVLLSMKKKIYKRQNYPCNRP